MYYLLIITFVLTTPMEYTKMEQAYTTYATCVTAGKNHVAKLNLSRTGHEVLADKAAGRVITYACPKVVKP